MQESKAYLTSYELNVYWFLYIITLNKQVKGLDTAISSPTICSRRKSGWS